MNFHFLDDSKKKNKSLYLKGLLHERSKYAEYGLLTSTDAAHW